MMYAAFLRGINVGGKASLPMKDLAAIFADSGAIGIKTYIQSGNVLFNATSDQAAATCVATVTAAIATQYGYPGRIVLRSEAELHDTFTHNPFLNAGAPESTLHIYFLNDLPTPESVKALDPERSPGDSFTVRKRAIYLHLPNGMARTKLTNAYFDSRLNTVSTARNWNTAAKLLDMMNAPRT